MSRSDNVAYSIVNQVEQAARAYLAKSGVDGLHALGEIQRYVLGLQPRIEQQASLALAGDPVAADNVGILEDMIYLEVGDLGLGIAHEERVGLASLVGSSVRTAIALIPVLAAAA